MSGTKPTPRGLTHHAPPPSDPSDLAKFPSLSVSGAWFRAHVELRTTGDRGCWYFSSVVGKPEESGRFDLPGSRGSCYMANTEECAVRERIGTQLRQVAGTASVLRSVLHDKNGLRVIVSAITVSQLRSANISVREAQKWINRSLWSGTGIYAISQAWADLFDRAGFEAIRYPPRFTLGERARALALFGSSGPDPTRSVASHRSLEEVLEALHIKLVSPPHRPVAVLDAAEPPPPM